MKIIFAGTPVFAERHLQALIDSDHQIAAVYTQPDRPAGRGKKLLASPVKQLALKHGLTVNQPASLKSPEAQAELRALNVDLMVVVAYGLLLPKAVLDTPAKGCINVHGSILPRWRGAAPIQRAVQAGDKQSGVTIMQMDVGLDTGAMLLKAYCNIDKHETSATLHDKLADIGPPALLETIDLLANEKTQPKAQDDALANYASKIDKREAKLDWFRPAVELDRDIRAFNPFPICFSEINGERVKIHQAEIDPAITELKPGQLALTNGELKVGCGDAALTLLRIQLPGKKAMLTQDYLNGIGHTLPAEHFDSL